MGVLELLAVDHLWKVLAFAEGPVGACQTRLGGAHQPAGDQQAKGSKRGCNGETLEGHRDF